MPARIPLQVSDGRLVLASIVENPSLRIRHAFVNFVIDTGSADSYLSDKDGSAMQIPLQNRPTTGQVDVGGSRYQEVALPKMTLHLLEEGPTGKPVALDVSMSALRTTKQSARNVQRAQSLPSILGLNFLREQHLSLHVVLTENMAYLQIED